MFEKMTERGDVLRDLMRERLSAAAEEIFALFERTIVEFEEEVHRFKDDNQRKQQLLESVLSPRVRLHKPVSSDVEDDREKRQTPETDVDPETTDVQIQTAPSEAQTLHIKQEPVFEERKEEQTPQTDDRNQEHLPTPSSATEREETAASLRGTKRVTSPVRRSPRKSENAALWKRDLKKKQKTEPSAKKSKSVVQRPGRDAKHDLAIIANDCAPQDANSASVRGANREVSRAKGFKQKTKLSAKKSKSVVQRPGRDANGAKAQSDSAVKTHYATATRAKKSTAPNSNYASVIKANDATAQDANDASAQKNESTIKRKGVAQRPGRDNTSAPRANNAKAPDVSNAIAQGPNEATAREANNTSAWNANNVTAGDASDAAAGDASDAAAGDASGASAQVSSHRAPRSKVFKCSECDKGFGTRRHLERHGSVHTNWKLPKMRLLQKNPENLLYMCQFCKEGFNLKKELYNHLKIHLRKPFGCSLCPKRYTTERALHLHTINHTAAEPFGCYICHKRFTQEHQLKRHKKIHFRCSECGKMFSCRREVLRHNAREHLKEQK